MKKTLMLFVLTLMSCIESPPPKTDLQGRPIKDESGYEVCRNGVVYYYNGGYMGYSPKYLRNGKVELCDL